VGRNSVISAGTAVMKSILPGSLAKGNPPTITDKSG
jgi:acetyltransferase-like isoleucine patch superfamily enzyme